MALEILRDVGLKVRSKVWVARTRKTFGPERMAFMKHPHNDESLRFFDALDEGVSDDLIHQTYVVPYAPSEVDLSDGTRKRILEDGESPQHRAT